MAACELGEQHTSDALGGLRIDSQTREVAERENYGDLSSGELSHYIFSPASTGDKETHHASCKLLHDHAEKGPVFHEELYPSFNLVFPFCGEDR